MRIPQQIFLNMLGNPLTQQKAQFGFVMFKFFQPITPKFLKSSYILKNFKKKNKYRPLKLILTKEKISSFIKFQVKASRNRIIEKMKTDFDKNEL